MELLDLIIVGAGPAGLAAAVEATDLNVGRYLVLEKSNSHNSMIRTFYKEGKRVDATYAGIEALCMGLMCLRDGNRESYLQMMDQVVGDYKIPIRNHTELWSVEKDPLSGHFKMILPGGENLMCRFVIVAIGKMGRPKQPDYYKELPADLKRNGSLCFDINSTDFAGKKVLIVGGGDSASEYAQMLSEIAQVSLSYRQSSFSRMNALNLKLLNEKIASQKVRALLGSNIKTVENINGKPQVLFQEPSFTAESFDHILFALGGMSPVDFMRNSKVEMTESGNAKVNENGESTVAGLYVIGDLAGKGHGGGSIIAGFNAASRAVRDLASRYLSKELPAERVLVESTL